MQRFHIWSALLIALILSLMLAMTGTVYAVDEQMDRATILSGGGTIPGSNANLRSAFGEPVAGTVFGSSGASVCSGFLCAPALEPAACIALTDVTVNGPTIGVTNTAYTYVALISPGEATGPVVYTWSPEPSSGQGTASASISFASTGPQVVSVTASNCSGSGSANDGLAVTINSSSSGTAVTAVAIDGPTSGSVDTDYTFTATVSPPNADTPINYNWSPAPKSGQGTPNAVYSFSSSGAQNISVTAQNAAGGNSDLHTIVISSSSSGKAVTGVAIGGPTSGSTNTDYSFTAIVTPSDAETPITYTWSPEPKSGQGTASAVYNFPTSGTQNISVIAQNALGSGNDQHVIEISSSSGSDQNIYLPTLLRTSP